MLMCPSGLCYLHKFYFSASNEVSAILDCKTVFYFREAGTQIIKIICRLINWQFPWCRKRRTSMLVHLMRYLPLVFLKCAHKWSDGRTQGMKRLTVNGKAHFANFMITETSNGSCRKNSSLVWECLGINYDRDSTGRTQDRFPLTK